MKPTEKFPCINPWLKVKINRVKLFWYVFIFVDVIKKTWIISKHRTFCVKKFS